VNDERRGMKSTPSFAAPILAHVWQFRSFSPDTLDALAANAERETAARGAVVIREGEAGIDAFVVIEGRLEVQIAGKTGPLPIAVLTAGDLFGEVAIVAGAERRTASVVALTPVTLLRIDGASFAQAIDDDHARPELEAARTAWPSAASSNPRRCSAIWRPQRSRSWPNACTSATRPPGKRSSVRVTPAMNAISCDKAS